MQVMILQEPMGKKNGQYLLNFDGHQWENIQKKVKAKIAH
jgi:hypothetical protein